VLTKLTKYIMANIKSVDQLLVLILMLAATVDGMENPVL